MSFNIRHAMKITVFLVVLELFVQYISCNDSILSKFHQNGYKIKDFRAELITINEKYYNFFQVRTFKYNRTTPATNATFNMKITVKDKIEVVVQVLKFLSNEYRHFPVRFQINVRRTFESNAIGLHSVKNCGNVTNFSFEKDVTYHACNFVIDETHLPPLIPNGRYKIDQKLLYLDEEIAHIATFAEVYTPIEYPKN